ncbi:MAG: TIGR03013 family PEP-CTERM/XrtA system glycosyltransferase [Alphaproteobacteria bacterium]|nr:MAG: TIGR03013 family PEP-CTERM/XrtA system glycosyltransferase [Alphaproteobacteria bacterium]
MAMIRIFRHYVPVALIVLSLIEIATLFGAYLLGEFLRLRIAGLQPDPLASARFDAVVYAIVTWVAMVSVGLYQSRTTLDLRETLLKLFVALFLAVILLAVIGFVTGETLVWRSVLLVVTAEVLIVIPLIRWTFARIVDLDLLRRRIFLLGEGARAARARELAERPDARFRIVGGCDCRQARGEDQGSCLIEQVIESGASEIVVACEREQEVPIAQLLDCRLKGIAVQDIAAFIERETGRVDLDTLDPAYLVFSDGFVGGRFYERLAKRGFDVLLAGSVLIVSLPVMLLAALAIRLTSPGPVFYRQERVGRGGRIFHLLKFRSMVVDAEPEGHPRWASADDPRITPVGRFLRMTRIDELPQVINVLKSEMSFVGPRPERPFFVARLARDIPFYRERHAMKPGITGWAQINYPYGASIADSRRKLEYDLYYIKNYTLFLDIVIILQTLRVILFADGAR